MAFKLLKSDMMGTSPIEYLNGTEGETYVVGEVLCTKDNAVTKADVDSTGRQQYICAGNVTIEGETVTQVPCYRIIPGRIYTAPLIEVGSALGIGDKITLSPDGLGVTANKTNGVCEIVHMESFLPGGILHVRFE